MNQDEISIKSKISVPLRWVSHRAEFCKALGKHGCCSQPQVTRSLRPGYCSKPPFFFFSPPSPLTCLFSKLNILRIKAACDHI